MTLEILSFPIRPDNPSYPGNPATKFEEILSIKRGDLNNTTLLTLYTHNDTHMDAPRHFNNKGVSVDNINPEKFIYRNVRVVDVSPSLGRAIHKRDICDYIKEDTDLLLIYSGVSQYWETAKEKFIAADNQPWISADAAEYLINETNVSGIGVDFMCVDNIKNLVENRTAPIHSLFCGLNSASRTILIYENVNVRPVINEKVQKVYAIPLMLADLDGSPLTVVAEL
jgi:arylformamidase